MNWKSFSSCFALISSGFVCCVSLHACISLQIFYFKKVLSTSLNIFRICEPVLASEHATKQCLMDCATPKFGDAHGHVSKIGHSDLKLVDSVKIGLRSKSVRLWKSLDMAKLPQMENWSFQGLSEANLCVLEPRVFPLKVEKCVQGFPNPVRILRLSQYLTCT